MKYSILWAAFLASIVLTACSNKVNADLQQSSATSPGAQNQDVLDQNHRIGAANTESVDTATPPGQGVTGPADGTPNGSSNAGTPNGSSNAGTPNGSISPAVPISPQINPRGYPPATPSDIPK